MLPAEVREGCETNFGSGGDGFERGRIEGGGRLFQVEDFSSEQGLDTGARGLAEQSSKLCDILGEVGSHGGKQASKLAYREDEDEDMKMKKKVRYGRRSLTKRGMEGLVYTTFAKKGLSFSDEPSRFCHHLQILQVANGLCLPTFLGETLVASSRVLGQ